MPSGGINGGRNLGRASGSIVINTDSLGRAQVAARRVGQDVSRSLGGINGGAKQAQAGLTGFSRQMNLTAGAGKLLGGILAGLALRRLVQEVGSAVNAASNLRETLSKTSSVFRDSTQDMLAWSQNSATAFGLSRQAALEAAGTIGNMFDQLGAGSQEAARLSQGMVSLSADLASFHNVAGGAAEVLVAMQSAFRGEYDALQRYIPTITAAAVEQQALADTGKASAKQLTMLDKAYAAQAIMLRDAGAAMGDFQRTSGEAANQQRILGAQITDLSGRLGGALLPAYREILRGLNRIVSDVAPYGENVIASFAGGLARAINRFVVPALSLMRQMFSFWLRPGSPPKLLPDLTKWGQGAMEAYLAGWGDADFGIFDDLARSLESVIRSFAGAGAIPETDLVSQVFGSRTAIARAVSEFRNAGSVGAATLAAIGRAAGPAGAAVQGLVQTYFELARASQVVARAQDELTEVTRRYDAALSPIQAKLDAVQNQQSDIRDQQRAAELNEQIADATTTASERQLAQLELQEIELRRQMRTLEEEKDTALDGAQAKLDAAQREEAARRAAYDAQKAAVDQQMATNRLVEEERNLRERLANEALTEQEKRLRELEQAQKEMERAEKEGRAELERVYQAQLQYNMQIADTPGKIALLKLELQRYTEGSAEYYDILTQIAALEQSLASEREAAASGSGGSPLDALAPGGVEALGEISQEYDDLASAIRNAMDAATGEGDDTVAPTPESGLPEWLQTILQTVKDVAEALHIFQTEVDEWQPDLAGWKRLGDEVTALLRLLRGEWTATNQGIQTETEGSSNVVQAIVVNTLRSLLAIFGTELTAIGRVLSAGLLLLRMIWASTLLAIRGEWEGAWAEIKRNFGEALREIGLVLLGQLRLFLNLIDIWFGLAPGTIEGHLLDAWQAVVDWGTDLWDAGYNAVKNLWDGIKSYWDTIVVPAWTAKTQWLRDMLPGSEPRNPQSPLRNLGDAGAALLDNFVAGMDRRALALTPAPASALTARAAAVASSQTVNHYYMFDQQFNAQPDWGLTRQASREGVLAALRTRGR